MHFHAKSRKSSGDIPIDGPRPSTVWEGKDRVAQSGRSTDPRTTNRYNIKFPDLKNLPNSATEEAQKAGLTSEKKGHSKAVVSRGIEEATVRPSGDRVNRSIREDRYSPRVPKPK